MMDTKTDRLVFFGSERAARDDGFGPRGRHPDRNGIWAWWPAMGADALRGRRWAKVVIDQSVWNISHNPGTLREIATAKEIARHNLVHAPMEWIEP